jgi:3-deoxy-manno-octulosonate cytidylyltransferase (CMP-KDO synthetase)
MTQVLGVIPARLGSTRLPRKPLHRLAGRPLLEWVWRRVRETGLFSELVVATDSEEIASVARGFGAQVELTSPTHPSGTDRVAEVARLPRYREISHIVNVQGDEPFVRPEHLRAAVELVREEGWPIGTVASPLADLAAWRDPAVVKVVCAHDGSALYFSRAPVPFARDAEPDAAELEGGAFLRHIGIYAYRRDALLEWVALPAGVLEHIEKLEQLRPLAGGARIGVRVVEAAEGGVDTPEDAARAERRLLELYGETASA